MNFKISEYGKKLALSLVHEKYIFESFYNEWMNKQMDCIDLKEELTFNKSCNEINVRSYNRV